MTRLDEGGPYQNNALIIYPGLLVAPSVHSDTLLFVLHVKKARVGRLRFWVEIEFFRI